MPVATTSSTTTTLNYFVQTTGEKPYQYLYEPPEGQPRTNIEPDPHRVVIHDIRGREQEFDVDNSGFQVLKSETGLSYEDWEDEGKVTSDYYKEVEDLLKKTTGAKRIFIFDHTIRRRSNVDLNDPKAKDTPTARGPVSRVHIDQTPKAGQARVHRHMGDDAARLSQGRAQIINVWRPLRGPVQDVPLAVADYRTISPEDLVPADLRYEDRTGETYSVRFNEKHRFWWVKDQGPDEVLLLKCYESDPNPSLARLTPHTAFVNEDAPMDALPRESIEVRALVFTPSD